jgi:hypothetical protein
VVPDHHARNLLEAAQWIVSLPNSTSENEK